MAAISLLDNRDRFLKELLAPDVSGLFTDADGTLSEIRDRPEEAEVDRRIADTLVQLQERYRLAAVVSGRRARDVARMVGKQELVYIGNHGLEELREGRLKRDDAAVAAVAEAKRELMKALSVGNGVEIEDKRSVLAVHYRRCPDKAVIDRIVRTADTIASKHGLRTQIGRKVVELRPLSADKGAAILRASEKYGLKQVLFFGDDRTDLDAVKTLKEERNKGGVASVTVGVITPESPPELEEEADYKVSSVSQVGDVLEMLARRGARDRA